MQKVRTNHLVTPKECPPIPWTHWVRPVYITAIPTSSSLRYVFNVVMIGERGAIGWEDEMLILYLMIEKGDVRMCPDLVEGTELWAVFKVRSNQ